MDIFLGIVIILFAGFTQGLTSFGFALISMPFLSKFIPLQVVVPIIVILSLISNVAVLYDSRKDVDLRKLWVLIFSSIAAAPFGAYILLVVDANALKICIGILIILFAFLLLNGISFPVRKEKLAYIPVGAASGLLNGSISLSGPPVALFLSNQGADKRTFRANITAYALILNIITVATFWYAGIVVDEVVRYSAWFVPAMFVGVHLGIRTLKYLSETLFRKAALYLIILSGIWTIVTGLKLV